MAQNLKIAQIHASYITGRGIPTVWPRHGQTYSGERRSRRAAFCCLAEQRPGNVPWRYMQVRASLLSLPNNH